MSLTILYRGPLSSCNYDCHYCPFAKQVDSAAELHVDRESLNRFVDWAAEAHVDDLRVFFTPWGEALVRRWYWDAFAALTAMDHVSKVAVQTNLSCRLDWLDRCDPDKVGLWCTYHPSQISLPRFVAKVDQLRQRGISHSVGTVGMKEDIESIEAIRDELPSDTYLWVNAFKRERPYYDAIEIERLTRIDPNFPTNNIRHPSLGKECVTGQTVISVDGDGTIRRCHFVSEPIGNLYDRDFQAALRKRACPNQTCGCHIGYVHLQELNLETVYGSGVLERSLAGQPSAAIQTFSMPNAPAGSR